MIIRPSDVHENWDRALLGVLQIAKDLGVECQCKLKSQWIVKIDGNERETFLELAREAANVTKY